VNWNSVTPGCFHGARMGTFNSSAPAGDDRLRDTTVDAPQRPVGHEQDVVDFWKTVTSFMEPAYAGSKPRGSVRRRRPLCSRFRKDAAMLMRFEPFREFDRITEELLSASRARQIPVDAYRRGDEFTVNLDLPGVDAGSIELTVEKDVLSVRATRTWMPIEGDQIQATERAQGEFSRQLFLGESLDRDHVSASYQDGVLTITIPVAEQAKPRKVEISHAGGVVYAVEAATAAA
jgi:HSP20 family protein